MGPLHYTTLQLKLNCSASNENTCYSICDINKDLKSKIESRRLLAMESLEKARQKQNVLYDRRAGASNLKVGDNVLPRILSFTGPHKLSDKFEE